MNMNRAAGMRLIEFNMFSPAELAEASGLGVDMQRVWRKRGHLPPNDSPRASFDAREVIAIAIRYELSKLGVSPSHTVNAAEMSLPIVLFNALLDGERAVDFRGSIRQVAAIARSMADSHAIALQISQCESKGRYLWSCSPPDFQLIENINDLTDEAIHVAHVMLDLMVLGIRIVQRTPKPLVTIQAE